MSSESAREMNSLFAQVWYVAGFAGRGREAALEWGLALLCAVVAGSNSC